MSFAVYLFFFLFFSYEVWEQLIMFMLLIERRVEYIFSPYHNSHNVVIDAVPFIIVVSVSQCQAKEFDESVRN